MSNTIEDNGMAYAIKLQISAEDYHALVEHFAKPEEERMGRPLVAVNKVFEAYGWEVNLKACAAARRQTAFEASLTKLERFVNENQNMAWAELAEACNTTQAAMLRAHDSLEKKRGTSNE